MRSKDTLGPEMALKLLPPLLCLILPYLTPPPPSPPLFRLIRDDAGRHSPAPNIFDEVNDLRAID